MGQNIRFIVSGLIVGFFDLVITFWFSIYKFDLINYHLNLSASAQRIIYLLQFVIVIGLISLLLYLQNKQNTKGIAYFVAFACIGFIVPIIVVGIMVSRSSLVIL